jgi:hypothetical protein
MAIEQWVRIGAKHCELLDLDVELKERRIYPSTDFLRAAGNDYRVRACACSAAVRCNMTGISCQWAYTGPGTDRF